MLAGEGAPSPAPRATRALPLPRRLTGAERLRRRSPAIDYRLLGQHLFPRWDRGASFTLAAQTQRERQLDVGGWQGSVVDAAEADAEEQDEAALERSLHTLILAVGLGLRLPVRAGEPPALRSSSPAG